jgi:hypothetical protein
VWHLKWAQVNGVWLFIGGGALAAYDGSPVGLGGTSTPNIAIPYQGQYLVRFGGGVYVYTSGSAYASVTLIGPGYTDPGGLQIFSGSAMASSGSTERMATFTGTAGGIYTQWGASVNAVVATAWRWISLMPVWIKI